MNLGVNIEAVITALSDRYTTGETALIERLLREHNGTTPDNQLIEEIGLALAVYRRQQQGETA